MNKLILFILLIASCGLSQYSFSQEDSTKIVVVTKNDGGTYTGVIISDDGREILIDSKEVGKIYIPKHLIKTIESAENQESSKPVKEIKKEDPKPEVKIDPFDDGELGYKNFTSTKYIQSDNAFPLRPGEAFLKLMPVGLEVQIPLKPRWSMGAMSSFGGAPVVLKTKLSFPVFKSSFFSLDAAYGSMMFGGLFGVGISEGGGYFNTGFSFGDRENNFTAKLGFGLIHEDQEDWEWDELTQQPFLIDEGMRYVPLGIVSFSGMTTINDRTQFVFDIIAGLAGVNGNCMVGGAAARFGPHPRHRFQGGLSLLLLDDLDIQFPIPTLSYTFVFPQGK
jgi:hypothetical protein